MIFFYIFTDNDMITSFSNPNYQLNDADALNSNLPASQYYHDNGTHIYDEPANLVAMDDDEDVSMDTTTKSNSSSKRRKKYAHMDANTMGVVGSASVSPSYMSMTSPDSMTSEEQYSVESGFLSPGERTASMVEIEHTEPLSTDSDGQTSDANSTNDNRRRKGGFLGYYASLEKSVKERNSGKRSSSRDQAEAESEETEDDGKSSGDDSGAISGTTPITPASTAESNASGASKTDRRSVLTSFIYSSAIALFGSLASEANELI